MAQLASDNFIRANENPLNAANWTVPTTCSALQVVSNKCESVILNSTCEEVWTGRVWPNDQYSEVTVQSIDTAGDIRAVVRGSVSAETNYFVQVLGIGVSQSVKLFKVVAHTFTQLGTTQTVTVTAGDIFRCEAQGTAIRAKQNGTTLVTAIDAAITSGSPGLELDAPTTLVNTTVSLWAGGDFSVSSGGWVNRERKFVNKR